MRRCLLRCSHHSNRSTNGSLKLSSPRGYSNMLPCRRCSPRGSDMSRYRSSEQVARAQCKQMALATNSGGIARNRHLIRPVPSQCSDLPHFKRMVPGRSSDPSSPHRTLKPNIEHLCNRRRRLSNSVCLRSRCRNSSTCPPHRRLSSSDLRNLHYNNSALHSRLPNNSDPHN